MTIRGMIQGRTAHLAAVTLAAVLTTGAPLAWAASPAASARAAAALTVLSEPAGAAVYVDGQFKGETPLAIEALGSGDHSLTLTKDGFLENRRMVSQSSGHSVEVALTPTAARPFAAMQVEPEPASKKSGGGGGSKKALLIGLGAVAAGAIAFVALKGSNKPPVVSGVTATPATALQGVTSVTFNANASDPDGDQLTYEWDFGDGGTGTGASPSHVYASAGTFSVAVKVSDGKKSTTGNGSVTVKSMAGAWRGSLVVSGYSFPLTINFAQSGTSLSGSYVTTYGSGPLNGTVSAPQSVRFTATVPGYYPLVFNGTLDGALNTVSGTATDIATYTFSITRQ